MSLLGRASIGLISSLSCVIQATNERSTTEVRAISTLRGKSTSGDLEFVQSRYTSNTEITGSLKGLYPDHKHGVQIHEGSDSDLGEIFNPFSKPHGGPWNPERKVGDLGNVQADREGNGLFQISDPYVKLSGPFSVIGKVFAVHENPDDLGFGRNEESKRTGGVGKALAAGVISKH